MNARTAVAATLACAAILSSQTLTPAQKKMLASIDDAAPDSVALLERLVNIKSGTFNSPG